MTNVHHVDSASLSRIFPTGQGRTAPAREQDAPAETETKRTDQVDLSENARALNDLSTRADVRADLVARVRNEIAGGTYVTQDKIDAAIDALSTELQD